MWHATKTLCTQPGALAIYKSSLHAHHSSQRQVFWQYLTLDGVTDPSKGASVPIIVKHKAMHGPSLHPQEQLQVHLHAPQPISLPTCSSVASHSNNWLAKSFCSSSKSLNSFPANRKKYLEDRNRVRHQALSTGQTQAYFYMSLNKQRKNHMAHKIIKEISLHHKEPSLLAFCENPLLANPEVQA